MVAQIGVQIVGLGFVAGVVPDELGTYLKIMNEDGLINIVYCPRWGQHLFDDIEDFNPLAQWLAGGKLH
jgi:hypothetical protein